MKRFLSFPGLTALLVAALAVAGLRADAPPGYYTPALGLTGVQLRDALHEIINDHLVVPYSSTAADTADALKFLDEDPANPDHVWLLYAQRSEPKASFGLSTGWNREHQWCNSYGLDDLHPAFSDLHNLRAEDANVNSARGNEPYDLSDPTDPGFADPAHPEALLCTSDSNSWQPPAAVRGDIARSLFYMDVRYEGDRLNEPDLVLTSDLSQVSVTAAYMGHLAVLLQWHRDDPVDAAEMVRNDLIHSLFQGNRNPFVDHPEWVDAVFGGGDPTPVAPVIITQPQDRSVTLGSSVTFNVAASGTGPLTYQWYLNDTAIAGAVDSGHTIPAVQAADLGLYSVRVANSVGSVVSTAARLSLASDPPVVLARWDFNSQPADANPGTGTLVPVTGAGTASLIGGTSGSFATGSASDTAGGADNSGWNTAAYPAQGSGNKTAGVQFAVSTAGHRNLKVSWDQRLSATASRYSRLQYSVDGVNFTDAGVVAFATDSVFVPVIQDLSAIPALNDRPRLVLRIVAEFESTAVGSGTAGYVTPSGTSYRTSGTVRFDSVTVTASPLPMVPPAAPTGLAATAGNAVVQLGWMASDGAGSYTVKRSPSTGGPYSVIAAGITATAHADASVANGTTYHYVVSASNAAGESNDSNEVAATPSCPLPAAPGGLTATAGNAQVSLAWGAVPGAVSYEVRRTTTAAGPYQSVATGISATGFVDTSVVNGTTYHYVVAARNSCGTGLASAPASATPTAGPVPGAPSGLTATAGRQRISLAWNDNSTNETGFRIERSMDGVNFTGIATVAANTRKFTNSGLTTGTRYHYRVRSFNANGNSTASNIASAVAQ